MGGRQALRQGQALASGRFSQPERRWEQGHAAESCRKAPPRGNGTFGERGTKQRHLSRTSHPTQLLQGGQSYQIPARFGEAHPDHFLPIPNTWMGPKGSARAAWCWCPPPGTQPGADTTFEPQDQKPTRVWGSAAHLQLLPWPHTGPPRAGPSPPSPTNCFGHGVLAPPHPHVQPDRSALQLSARGDAQGCQHGLTEGMSSGKNLHLKCS